VSEPVKPIQPLTPSQNAHRWAEEQARKTMHEQKIWPTALRGLALMVAVTLGWILTFDSGLLSSIVKPDHPAETKSGVP
jgi:hypothetical protein